VPLVPCPDCHRRISDAAPACVHCGRPIAVSLRPTPLPGSPRRHPLAGAGPADGPSTRAVLRIVVAAIAIGLVLWSWISDGGPRGRSDLTSGLISLAVGASLLLMPVPEPPPRTPGARCRADWGQWFSRQEAQREFHWSWIAGWVLVLAGAALLLMAAP